MMYPNESQLDRYALIDTALTTAGLSPEQGYQAVPAAYLLQSYHPTVEIELPLIIDAGTALTAQEVQRLQTVLQNAYPATHPVTLVTATAGAENNVQQLTLQTLTDTTWPSAHTLLCLPPMPAGSSFSALQAIVAHLRSPVGCPWDRKQTLESMRHDLLGECAEVLEAVDLDSVRDNSAHIAEELGDVLMAAVLMVQIATDEGRFQMTDAMQSIVAKLIRRHPHVFGDVTVDGVETVLTNWDAIKAQEKLAKGQTQSHPLDGVPAALPALEKARELQAKAAKAGLLDRAVVAQQAPSGFQTQSAPSTEEELGERLWQLVAQAHGAGLNAEDALRAYTLRFRAAHA